MASRDGEARGRSARRGRQPSVSASLARLLDHSPRARHSAGLLLLLLAASAILLLVYARPLTQTIAVGSRGDRALTSGFHDREVSPAGIPFRWTDDASTLIFRGAGLAFPANRSIATALTMTGGRPANAAPAQVTIALDDRSLGGQAVIGETTVRLAAPAGAATGVDTRVTITSTTFMPPGDRRQLGVALLGAARLVEEPGDGLALPPWGAWWRWLATLLLAWAVTFGLSRRPLRIFVVTGGMLLCLSLAMLVIRPQFWELIHLPLLFLLALLPIVWRDDLRRWSDSILALVQQRARCSPAPIALAGALLVATAQTLLSSGALPLLALLLGLLGLILLLAVLLTHSAGQPAREEHIPALTAGAPVNWRHELLLLGGILILAAAARFVRLGDIPFSLWRDEARHGLEALRMLREPDYRPTYIPNISLPGLYPALLALDFRAFGASIASLRGLTAGAGVLAIAALWAVARQLWGVRVALVAALLGAIGSWRVSIDRLAFDTAPTTLCTLGAFAAFLWGVRMLQGTAARRRSLPWLAFAAAGLLAGLAIYGYYPGRFALPVLTGATVLLLIRARRSFAPRLLLGYLVTLALAALMLIPLARYAIARPNDFFKRTEQVYLLADSALVGQTALEAVERNLLRHVVMFNWRGEPNARHHAPGWPMLDAVTAACFIAGIGLTIALATRLNFSALFTLEWLIALLGPSIVSVDAPSAVRAMDAAPAAYLIAAVGLVALWQRWRQTDVPGWLRRAASTLVSAVLAIAIAINLWLYFWRLPGDPRVLGKFEYAPQTRAGQLIAAVARDNPGLIAYLPGQSLTGGSGEVLTFTAGGAPLRELPAGTALPTGPAVIIVPHGEEIDFAGQLAAARQVASAAGLVEVPGDAPPGGGAPLYVAFVPAGFEDAGR